MESEATFSELDWLSFIAVLVTSLLIGLYFTCAGGKQKTVVEFFMAERAMGWLSVSASLFSSYMSALTIMLTPLEIYKYGTSHLWIILGYPIAIWISSTLFVPVFHKLSVNTVNEYLKMRFNKWVAYLSLFFYLIMMILYMSLVLFVPACIYTQVILTDGKLFSNTNSWISIVVVGMLATAYTSLGGMKAVLWTDFYQALIMFVGVVIVLGYGLHKEGIVNIWEAAKISGRLDFLDTAKVFNMNPKLRQSVFGLMLGSAASWTYLFSVNQTQVQRCLTLAKLNDIKKAYWINALALPLLGLLCSLCGLVIFSHYRLCDPISTNKMYSDELLLPFYVLNTMGSQEGMKGLPGLVLAAISCASLSTISSGINSIATCLYYDVLLELRPKFADFSRRHGPVISKLIALSCGVICILIAIAMSLYYKDNADLLLSTALSLFSILGGPMLGLFILAFFTERTNSVGAGIALFIGTVVNITVGALIILYGEKNSDTEFPLPIACPNITQGDIYSETYKHLYSVNATSDRDHRLNEVDSVGDICYQIVVFFGLFVTMICGYSISFIYDKITGREPAPVDQKLKGNLTNLFTFLSCCRRCCPNTTEDLNPGRDERSERKLYKVVRDDDGKILFVIWTVANPDAATEL